jgi:astacin (peptidase family M12A)
MNDRSGEFRKSDNHQTVRVALTTKEVDIVVAALEGDVLLFEGDIAVRRPAMKAVGISGTGLRWPSARIPFEIESGDKTAIEAAIEHWSRTKVRFVPHNGESDFVVFRSSGNGSDSEVGRRGGRQFINILKGAQLGIIIHEIGHAVGLWHEHSREDRDKHVKVLFDNIESDAEINFAQYISDGDDIGDYDFDSIMHYPPNAFAVDPSKPTLRGNHGESFGQRTHLSDGDIAAVAQMYA